MALVTSQSSLPDFEHEYHTITVDTIGQLSKNTFTVHLQQTLENIVQARLVAAQITTTNSNVCYISVNELDTNYSQRTSNLFGYEGQSSLSKVNNSFGSLISGSGTASEIVFKDNYPVVQQYSTPIRKIDRLTFSLYNQDGNTIEGTKDNFFIFRFVCKQKNLPPFQGSK
jgi:4-diphosphocytidyl-2C-methyl-D-erythritol kinase